MAGGVGGRRGGGRGTWMTQGVEGVGMGVGEGGCLKVIWRDI